MIKTITVPTTLRDKIQKADIERSSRRDIITYILEKGINVPEERFAKYQSEYDEKFRNFEQAKNELEKEYVMPATNGTASNWSLDYSTCVVTITVNE